MKGYEFIRNLPDRKISEKFMVGEEKAINIRNSTKEQMINSDYICPQLIFEKYDCKCKNETFSCVQCKKEFLENEITT